MKLEFLGTKGEIEEETKGHHYNSSLLVTVKNFKLLIDHGAISCPLKDIKPDAILITHGHPDHFIWLKTDEDYNGLIYLSNETEKLAKFKKNFQIINIGKWIKIGPFDIFPYRVIHSLKAPAVGFKIKCEKTLLYNPDIIAPIDKSVLRGADLYIGDGSSVKCNLVRRKEDQLFGHTRISTQINWCKKYKIGNIIFTHFGKEALRIGDKKLEEKFKQDDINIKIARDGMSYNF